MNIWIYLSRNKFYDLITCLIKFYINILLFILFENDIVQRSYMSKKKINGRLSYIQLEFWGLGVTLPHLAPPHLPTRHRSWSPCRRSTYNCKLHCNLSCGTLQLRGSEQPPLIFSMPWVLNKTKGDKWLTRTANLTVLLAPISSYRLVDMILFLIIKKRRFRFLEIHHPWIKPRTNA